MNNNCVCVCVCLCARVRVRKHIYMYYTYSENLIITYDERIVLRLFISYCYLDRKVLPQKLEVEIYILLNSYLNLLS
jgi:hypothetical protein